MNTHLKLIKNGKAVRSPNRARRNETCHFQNSRASQLLERNVEDPLSEDILRGTFKKGDKIVAKMKNGRLVFEVVKKPKEAAEAASAVV